MKSTGVTDQREVWSDLPLYWPVATDQTRRSKAQCEVGPKLKYALTAWITLGCVCGNL